jgi:predicted enzyme related to lactoylglutathione lyase
MKILEFAFIGYPVTDIARARAFYEEVLGLICTTIHPHSSAVEYEIGPHTLLLGSGPEMKPSSDGPAVALKVENFDEAIAHLKQHKVAFLGEPFESPICRGAFILDPDGNKIGIHKRKTL